MLSVAKCDKILRSHLLKFNDIAHSDHIKRLSLYSLFRTVLMKIQAKFSICYEIPQSISVVLTKYARGLYLFFAIWP